MLYPDENLLLQRPIVGVRIRNASQNQFEYTQHEMRYFLKSIHNVSWRNKKTRGFGVGRFCLDKLIEDYWNKQSVSNKNDNLQWHFLWVICPWQHHYVTGQTPETSHMGKAESRKCFPKQEWQLCLWVSHLAYVRPCHSPKPKSR